MWQARVRLPVQYATFCSLFWNFILEQPEGKEFGPVLINAVQEDKIIQRSLNHIRLNENYTSYVALIWQSLVLKMTNLLNQVMNLRYCFLGWCSCSRQLEWDAVHVVPDGGWVGTLEDGQIRGGSEESTWGGQALWGDNRRSVWFSHILYEENDTLCIHETSTAGRCLAKPPVLF